jgi:GT2 family glycosyltransferase
MKPLFVPQGLVEWPYVSVIVLSYNGLNFTLHCIESVLSTEYPRFEVVFVDNGSTDGTMETVRSLFSTDPRMRFVQFDKNLGFAEANHYATSVAKGELYVFLNNDTIVLKDWLSELVHAVMTYERVGAAQSKLVFLANPRILQTCGQMLTPLGLIFDVGSGQADNGEHDRIVEIFSAQGAAIAVKREAYIQVGGFDPLFFSINEDTDLCWRLWLSGYKVIFVPRSVVQHASGGILLTAPTSTNDFSTSWKQARHFYSCRNRILTLLKNLGTRKLIFVLPAQLMFQVAEGLMDQSHGTRRNYLSLVLKAWFSVLKSTRSIYRLRLQVQRFRRLDDDELFRLVSRNISPRRKLRRRLTATAVPELGRELWG